MEGNAIYDGRCQVYTNKTQQPAGQPLPPYSILLSAVAAADGPWAKARRQTRQESQVQLLRHGE
jgi:hypothetical protein